MAANKDQKKWKKAISLMSVEELEFILEHPVGHYPEYLEMVEARMEKLSVLPQHEAMRAVVKNALEELGCKCKIDEEGNLDFYFQGSSFTIVFDESSHYLCIWEYFWKTVDLSDTNEVERLKTAINEANESTTVTACYEINEELQRMYVSSTHCILYHPMIANIKEYLYIRLSNFFFVHDVVNTEMMMMEKKEKDEKRLQSYILSNEAVC